MMMQYLISADSQFYDGRLLRCPDVSIFLQQQQKVQFGVRIIFSCMTTLASKIVLDVINSYLNNFSEQI